MKVRIFTVLAASFLAGSASAMDLMDLYREAKSNDARYAAARAQFRAAQEAVPQALAGAAPDGALRGAVRRQQISRRARFSRLQLHAPAPLP